MNVFKASLFFCTLLIGWVAGTSEAAVFYVAPRGDDTNDGSIEHPFASIRRAQESVEPGDTVLIRGGTYRMQQSQIAKQERIWAHVIRLDKSGRDEQRINYWAYENEQPVFDFTAVKPLGKRVHAFSVSGSWLHLRGIEVGGYGSKRPDQLPDPIPRHVVKACLAVHNKNSGFYANHHPGGSDWIGNSAYRNGTNFNLLSRLSDNVTDVPGYGHLLRKNLSYQSRGLCAISMPKNVTSATMPSTRTSNFETRISRVLMRAN